VFGGTKKIAVGENGGCIAFDVDDHMLLGNIEECNRAYDLIKSSIDNVQKKPVFPRLTEVVLERTFDMNDARKILSENDLNVTLSDSQYAIHINSKGIDKGTGFTELMKKFNILKDDVIAIGDSATDVPLFKVAKTSVALGNASDLVRSEATMTVSGNSGDGVLEALDKLAPKLSEI
jgi:hydroxymethylpyrimidine pyrophosphatase-like HAD family hydrolase